MGIKLFVLVLVFIVTLDASVYKGTETSSVQIRFNNINLLDFDYLEKRYGFEIEHCILDGLCVFKNTKNYDKRMLEHIRKNEFNIKMIRVQKSYLLKPY